jgi:hypothetical protein
MLDEQTAVHFSGDEEKASDDDGATTAEIYITEEEYNSTAIGDSGSQVQGNGPQGSEKGISLRQEG